MGTRFDICLAFVLKREGGYVNDPADRGGETACGITNATYQHWRHAQGLLPAPIKEITPAEVAAIYRADYWTSSRCDVLGPPLDLVHFDGAVNHGKTQAAKFLQRAAGVTADGVIGARTLAAVAPLAPGYVALKVIEQREAFYRWLATKPDQAKFLKGWLARMAAVRNACGLAAAS